MAAFFGPRSCPPAQLPAWARWTRCPASPAGRGWRMTGRCRAALGPVVGSGRVGAATARCGFPSTPGLVLPASPGSRVVPAPGREGSALVSLPSCDPPPRAKPGLRGEGYESMSPRTVRGSSRPKEVALGRGCEEWMLCMEGGMENIPEGEDCTGRAGRGRTRAVRRGLGAGETGPGRQPPEHPLGEDHLR